MLTDFTLDDVCETIETFPANIAIFDVEPGDRFVIRSMSHSLEILYGIEPGAAKGIPLEQFTFDDETKARLKTTYIRCRDTRMQVTMDEEIPRPDGSSVWTSRTVVPLMDDAGDVVALISTVIDITELVKVRSALVRTLSVAATGFVTICAWCRNIKDEREWVPLEKYVNDHPGSGIVVCPECASHRSS